MKVTKVETNVKRKLYFHKTLLPLSPITQNLEQSIILVEPELTFQTVLGFGGAFTESTGYALSTVKKDIASQILDDYFSKDGLNYNLCRLPIGSCDFSLNSYSYSYKKDLSDFSIKQDEKYIIPAIKEAQKRNPSIQFLASPWSPPSFMKDNKNLYYGGKLEKTYKQNWANYLVKYVEAYLSHGIPISYMTIQNEPEASQPWESCLYTSFEEADLLKNYLVPTFKKNKLTIKFLIWDHNKEAILKRSMETLVQNGAYDFASGIAFHWYVGSHFENLAAIHRLFPEKLLIHTEGCTGYSNFKTSDELYNSELYASEIIGDFNNGTNGFIDWNMVLEYNGGPNHKQNYCNSPIMLNKSHTDYIKTPSFYYIGHFSKYVKPGAKRIHTSSFSDKILVTAFKNLDNSVIIILLNKNNTNIEYNLCYKNYFLHDNLDSHCIVTFILKGE